MARGGTILTGTSSKSTGLRNMSGCAGAGIASNGDLEAGRVADALSACRIGCGATLFGVLNRAHQRGAAGKLLPFLALAETDEKAWKLYSIPCRGQTLRRGDFGAGIWWAVLES